MSINAPCENPVFTPPAALVRMSVLTPRTPSTRTANVTVRGSWPSYRWLRPARAAIRHPSLDPTTRRPAWPATVDEGQYGRSPYGSDTASSSDPAKSPSPEPSTIATAGTSATLARMASAAAVTSS
jgi:hypothetical protein